MITSPVPPGLMQSLVLLPIPPIQFGVERAGVSSRRRIDFQSRRGVAVDAVAIDRDVLVGRTAANICDANAPGCSIAYEVLRDRNSIVAAANDDLLEPVEVRISFCVIVEACVLNSNTALPLLVMMLREIVILVAGFVASV